MKKTGYERQDRNDYYIVQAGEVEMYNNKNDYIDCKYYDCANYYSDRTVAENNARADKLMQQLRRFAVENNDSEIDWNDKETPKYYIWYDNYNKMLDSSVVHIFRAFGAIYFSSRKIAQKALIAFHDELMWYFIEYCDHVVESKDKSVVEDCELCKGGTFDNVGINNEGVWFGGRNAKIKDNEKIKFCPKCGRRLD